MATPNPLAPVKNNPGWWGPATATVDWCEPNYIWSFYIAEFFNTISSIPIALVGFIGLYFARKYRYERKFTYCYLALVGVGTGSTLFHGTLQAWGQALDELPMLWASCLFLYTLLSPSELSRYPKIHWYLGLYCLGLTASYLVLTAYFEYFVFMYLLLVLFILGRTFHLAFHPSITSQYYNGTKRAPNDITNIPIHIARMQRFTKIAATSYVFGSVFLWIPDHFICHHVQQYHFHAWFHMTSAFGCYMWLVFSTYYHYLQHTEPSLHHFIGLPYVHLHNTKST